MGQTLDKTSARDLSQHFTRVNSFEDKCLGQVLTIRDKRSNELYLLRQITISQRDSVIVSEYLKQKILRETHENLLQVKAFYKGDEEDALDTADETLEKVIIILEHVEFNFEDEIQNRALKNNFFTESEMWYLALSIISAMADLQEKGISHGDIRPTNIMMTKAGEIKIADPRFGLRKFSIDLFEDIEAAIRLRGLYSPLLLENLSEGYSKQVHNRFKSDVFSFGLALLSAATLQQVSNVCYLWSVLRIKTNAISGLINTISTKYSNNLRNLISMCVNYDENVRPDWQFLHTKVVSSLPFEATPSKENKGGEIKPYVEQPKAVPGATGQLQQSRVPLQNTFQGNLAGSMQGQPILTNQSQLFQQQVVQQPNLLQSGMQQSALQQSNLQHQGLQQQGLQQSALQQSALQQSALQQSNLQQQQGLQQSALQQSLQQPGLQTQGLQQAGLQQPGLQQSNMQPAILQQGSLTGPPLLNSQIPQSKQSLQGPPQPAPKTSGLFNDPNLAVMYNSQFGNQGQGFFPWNQQPQQQRGWQMNDFGGNGMQNSQIPTMQDLQQLLGVNPYLGANPMRGGQFPGGNVGQGYGLPYFGQGPNQQNLIGGDSQVQLRNQQQGLPQNVMQQQNLLNMMNQSFQMAPQSQQGFNQFYPDMNAFNHPQGYFPNVGGAPRGSLQGFNGLTPGRYSGF